MAERYTATRLTFRRDVIEPLSDGDCFEVETPDGVFRLTKSEFYRSFPGVVASASYRDAGLYNYARTPVRARTYLVETREVAGRPYAQPVLTMLSGNEPLHRDSAPLERTVGDFWRWSSSDLLSNALRGQLAEYLVAVALRVDDVARREWVAWDLTTRDGVRVEVKSSAYVQSWFQHRPSKIEFGVGETKGWNPDTAESDSVAKRQADVYVFALLRQSDRQLVDPLDVDHWVFFVVACADLDECLRKQEKVRLSRLRTVPHSEVPFDGIADAVRLTATRNHTKRNSPGAPPAQA